MPENIKINTTIKGISKQERNDGWVLTLDHRPGNSQYDTKLYGNDWDQLEGWAINSRCQVEMQKGNLKTKKDGTSSDPQYDSSYFWNLISINPLGSLEHLTPSEPDPDWDALGSSQSSISRSDSSSKQQQPAQGQKAVWPLEDTPGANHEQPPPKNDIQDRIEKGVAYNTAKEIAFAYPEAFPSPMISIADWHKEVRQLRDEIYHTGDIQTTVAPLHYCYIHDVARRKGKRWGHLNPPGPPCLEYDPDAPESNVEPLATQEAAVDAFAAAVGDEEIEQVLADEAAQNELPF